MKQYLELTKRILKEGRQVEPENARTASGYRSIIGTQMHFNLLEGFPIVTTKYTPFRLIIEELLFFIRGDTNNNRLAEKNVHIWDAWAHPQTGELGPIYGKQWREWEGFTPGGKAVSIDQLRQMIVELSQNPMTRRAIVNSWNPALLPETGVSHAENVEAGRQVLPPCHTMFQLSASVLTPEEQRQWREYQLASGIENPVEAKYGLTCHLYARSQDWFLGTPFNIASYALLTHIIANMLGWAPLQYVHTGGDCHLYDNQISAAEELLRRIPFDLPKLRLNVQRDEDINKMIDSLVDMDVADVTLVDYQYHSKISVPVEV